jgi:hypothetical protein
MGMRGRRRLGCPERVERDEGEPGLQQPART